MRTLHSALLSCLVAASLVSCKKDNHCIPTPTCTETGSWMGTYGSDFGQSTTVADSTFISGGIAKLANSPWSYFYSSIELAIPACREVDADAVTFEVRLKNPPKEIGSIADYDAALWLYGDNDSAHVQYIGFRPQFTYFGLQHKQITNSEKLLYIFTDFRTVSLEAKDSILTSKIDDTTTETLDYTGNKIGKLKKVLISFKGPGSIDWVKLYNSKTGSLLMKEDFDTNGKSTVNWY